MSRDYTPADERTANALERIADALEERAVFNRKRCDAAAVEAIARARFVREQYDEELWPTLRERYAEDAKQVLADLAAARMGVFGTEPS
ncbi:hypothetical protein [Nocardia abscessus]|uniref:hypothetical protein n=1 Tax=Nocardia abscessus TaxID=120957 RepID=UPI00245538A9|nr:hypothetical protein [Nocardia abscessus]